MTAFAEVAVALASIAAARGRTERVAILARLLGSVDADEVRGTVHLCLGRGLGRASGSGWATLIDAVDRLFPQVTIEESGAAYIDAGEWVRRRAGVRPQPTPPLTVAEVVASFARVAAAPDRGEKTARLSHLLARASDAELPWLVRNVTGEMRTGIQEGLMREAIARAAGIAASSILQRQTAEPDIGDVAAVLLGVNRGLDRPDGHAPRLMTPVPSMLADSAASIEAALARVGDPAQATIEWKIDGARIQIHREGDVIRLYSRRLTDVTDRLPDIVALLRSQLRGHRCILDGEAIVLDERARPVPFQDVMRRWLRKVDTDRAAQSAPATVYVFDCLLDEAGPVHHLPLRERIERLDGVRGDIPRMPALMGAEIDDSSAADFYRDAVARGHEGVMVKSLREPYAAGQRSAAWLKVKAEQSAEFVIVGADRGSGRRVRWLSNYHLACRDRSGALVGVGETFKGPTDALFEELTEALEARVVARRGGYVEVRPEIVVEVVFNGVQRSRRLSSGLALRFARIRRRREDRAADDITSTADLETLLA